MTAARFPLPKKRTQRPTTTVRIPKGSDVESFGKGFLFLGGGVLLISGTVWGISKLSQMRREQDRQDKVFQDTLIQGTPAYYASRLHRALNHGWFGWAEDEKEIKAVFLEIPSKAFYNRISSAYANLTKGESLNRDLDDLLSDSELLEIKQILNSKP